MIKLFEEWSQVPKSFEEISTIEFDENDESVQLREVDKRRIKLIFKNWEFKEGTGNYIHMTNVKWTDAVYLLIDSAKHNYILFWKNEADYFYVFHFTSHIEWKWKGGENPDPIGIGFGGYQSYKCDLLDGFEDLKNYLEKNFHK